MRLVRCDEMRSQLGSQANRRRDILPMVAVSGSAPSVPSKITHEAFAPDCAEGAIGIDQVQRIVRGVHRLPGGEKIEDRLNAQHGHEPGDRPGDAVHGAERLRDKLRFHGITLQERGRDPAPEPIVETGERGEDGQPVEEREVAGDDERELKGNDNGSPRYNVPRAARRGRTATTSSTTKVQITPNCKTGCGRKWNQRLMGFGIGCVSK